MLTDDIFLQRLLVGIYHLSVRLFFYGIILTETDSPITKQPQFSPHGMGTGFHDHKITFGNRFQFIRRHQRTLNHLQGLAGIILAPADGAAHDGSGTHCLAQHFGGLAVGSETTKDGILAVIYDDFRTLLAIIFFKLTEGLDNWHHRSSSQ